MQAQAQININASADRLWEILVDDFDQISKWTAAVYTSGPNPDLPVGDGRVCETTIGNNVEEMTHRDQQNGTFTYHVIPEKAPFFLNGIDHTWTIKPTGENMSQVGMDATVHLGPVANILMGPFMKRRMLSGFASILEELKYYAETNQIHPGKKEQIEARKLQSN